MTKADDIRKGSHVSKLKKILEKNKDNDQKTTSDASSQDVHHSKEINDLQKENDELSMKLEGLQRNFLIALADKDNLKKAMQKDIDSARDYGISKFAEQIVTSLDSLEKTVESIKSNNNTDNDQLVKNITDGLNMTLKHIVGALKDNGIEKIMPLGQKFDHNYHQAIKAIKGGSHEKGTIKEVLQCGYIIKSRILRPAMVVVFE